MHEKSHRGLFASAAAARRFIEAGHGTITIVSRKTGTRFTYRITSIEDKVTGQNEVLFVGLLRGPDNEFDYSYLGRIDLRSGFFWAGRKTPKPGDVSPDAPSSIAFKWAWRTLDNDVMPEFLEIWHEGRCGRCGRKLTVPASIESGFGPECINHV